MDTQNSNTWNQVQRLANRCMKQYGLISDGDKILIGLSGGKDSLALTEILGERKKIFKPRFELVAAHIQTEQIGYESNLDYLRAFTKKYNIPFVTESVSFTVGEGEKNPCFWCSWNRRKKLFELAEKLGCNKIALGHHQDDVLETLLLNMTFQGAVGTMPPILKMQKFDMTIIRPLSLVPESKTEILAQERNYQKLHKTCPYEKVSHRAEMKKLMQQLEQMNPNVRQSLWQSMMHVQTEYLPKKIE